MRAISLLDDQIPPPIEKSDGPTPVQAEQAFPLLSITATTAAGARITGRIGDRIGTPDSRVPLDKVSFHPPADLHPRNIFYCAVLGMHPIYPQQLEHTAWVTGETSQGVQGNDGPLRGIAIRLTGNAAEQFDCLYSATFVDGSRKLDCRNGALCAADNLAALESFQLSLRPKF